MLKNDAPSVILSLKRLLSIAINGVKSIIPNLEGLIEKEIIVSSAYLNCAGFCKYKHSVIAVFPTELFIVFIYKLYPV